MTAFTTACGTACGRAVFGVSRRWSASMTMVGAVLSLGVSVGATAAPSASRADTAYPSMAECGKQTRAYPDWARAKSVHYQRMLRSIRIYHSNKRIIEGGRMLAPLACECPGSAIPWEKAEALIPGKYTSVSNERQYLFEANRVSKLNAPLIPQIFDICRVHRGN